MRSTIGIIIGFLLLIGPALFIKHEVNETAEIIQSQLRQAETMIVSENFEGALAEIDHSYQEWSRVKSWYAIILNHDTLNNIEVCFIRLQEFTISQEFSLSLAEINALLFLLSDIPDSETLNLRNIL